MEIKVFQRHGGGMKDVPLQLSMRGFLKTYVLFQQEGPADTTRHFQKQLKCSKQTFAPARAALFWVLEEISPLCVIRCAPKWKRHRFYFCEGHPANVGEKKNPNPEKDSDGCRQTKSGRRWRRALPLQIASGDVLHNVMISLFGITSDDRHLSWNSQLTEYKTANRSDE